MAGSSLVVEDSRCREVSSRGGGFFARALEVSDSKLSVSGGSSWSATEAPAAQLYTQAWSGGGVFVQGPVRLANSTLRLEELEGRSALTARCLELEKSTLLLDVATEHGISLQNEDCECNATLRVDGVAGILSGRGMHSAMLFVEACTGETVQISNVHLQTVAAAVVDATGRMLLQNITVEYLQRLHQMTPLVVAPSFKAENVTISCAGCPTGVTFGEYGGNLSAVSSASLGCGPSATLVRGFTDACVCTGAAALDLDLVHDVSEPEHFHLPVRPSQTLDYCIPCPEQFEAFADTCRKCPWHKAGGPVEANGPRFLHVCDSHVSLVTLMIHAMFFRTRILKAWSQGERDFCHPWPAGALVLALLLLASAAFVILAAGTLEILWTPLAIIDAETTEDDSFKIAARGPICRLPESLARCVHSRVRYRLVDTGLPWFKSPMKLASLGRGKFLLEMQPGQLPCKCATSRGFLHATGYCSLILPVWLLQAGLLLLPSSLVISLISGNGVPHVLVTLLYLVLPLALCMAVLHPAVAWLLRPQWTELQHACEEYRIKLGPAKLCSSSDEEHPKNHGLQASILAELWGHFRRFILDRNMHFVVSNIVVPLTAKEQVSFASLLGGMPVLFFVSHSWGTSFPHFVKCITRHASFIAVPDNAYWICSFANNQWSLADELGTTVMDSSFARVLRSGIRGVVMVLDKEVQPLTRDLAAGQAKLQGNYPYCSRGLNSSQCSGFIFLT